jgi:uncharacterized protein (TIGR03083 family)
VTLATADSRSKLMRQTPDPVLVLGLFPAERRALLDLLESLPPDGWSRPTSAGDWTVKDVAAHLVADDLGRVSSDRDGHRRPWVPADGPLKEFIDRRNAEWVAAMRRLSPRVVQTLLEFGGRETQRLFESINPLGLGRPVAWAGPEPAPNWLDLAREFTERWHHQQQIREAVGAPMLTDATFLRPVLATFAFALVAPYRDEEAPAGTTVQLSVNGQSGGDWTLVREAAGWRLCLGRADSPTALVAMDEGTAWRMYVRALPVAEVEARSTFSGDRRLGRPMLDAFALVS